MSGALERGLRKELEKAVKAARRAAESGARAALGALAVDRKTADASMAPEQKELRRRLRAHGRALGDSLGTAGPQEITRLAHEVAYEHWHRMLFARFLAENELLMDAEEEIPVSLKECRDIARDEGRDAWELAASFAGRMLPQVFRVDDPSLAVRLPPESRQALEKLVEELPRAVFRADDSIGWAYQFWQAERKDEVNRSGVKIGADELPAVTQLFTERYMVRFLFHNTVGAWRAGKILAARPELATDAADEDELRQAVRLEAEGGYDFDYLRFVREPLDGEESDAGTGPWRPAAGAYSKWPGAAKELRVLDPCCGSGHFLVEGFQLFVRLRMEEEGLGLRDAVRAVLGDNLHGLEIDPRCAQLAAFSLALAAWKLAGAAIELPALNVACSGLAPRATKAEWRSLADQMAATAGSAPRANLFERRETLHSSTYRRTLGELHDLFQNAPTLGSLIDPKPKGKALFTDFAAVTPLLEKVLTDVETDPARREQAVAAAGIARAATLLAERYTLVITNVPYLGRAKQHPALRSYAERNHKAAKGELATMFVERAFRWLGKSGAQAFVLPQNWLFLKTYRKLREELLQSRRWRLVARLGPGAFETIGGHVVNVALTILSTETPADIATMAGLDVSSAHDQKPILAHAKASLLRTTATRVLSQDDQFQNPDIRITLVPIPKHARMHNVAASYQGVSPADLSRFGRMFWEGSLSSDFRNWQGSPSNTSPFAGRSRWIHWSKDLLDLFKRGGAARRGLEAVSHRGIGVGQMSALPATLYSGDVFDTNVAVIVPQREGDVEALWCYASAPEYRVAVRELDQKLNVTNDVLAAVPFDIERWRAVAVEKYPYGLPEPYSDDPTQWVFHGHPCGSVIWDETAKHTADGPSRTDATVLQIAVARLLGYRWPAEHDPDMRLSNEARAWVERCDDLLPFADEDGIVPLLSVRGEPPAADRLRELLAAAYGDEWSTATEQRLLRDAADGRKPSPSLDAWLRDKFFEEHCKRFHHRPLVWHIWDGLPGGFSALVNYHRLAGPDGEGRRTLESLAYSYLGDWIARQRAAVEEKKSGADARLEAALDLKAQLEGILAGEPPLDLFVRWKQLHRQPIGWEPDLDDGVRLNIRPFMKASLRKGRKGAGVLRWKPTGVKWGKDRGKEPLNLKPKRKGDPPELYRPIADFPWFWSCPGQPKRPMSDRTDFPGGLTFDGHRWNDLHYTRAHKLAARKRRKNTGPRPDRRTAL